MTHFSGEPLPPTADFAQVSTEQMGMILAQPDPPKPSWKSLETYIVGAAGTLITRVALSPDATWQQVGACLALAIVASSYAIGRSIAKRPPARAG